MSLNKETKPNQRTKKSNGIFFQSQVFLGYTPEKLEGIELMPQLENSLDWELPQIMTCSFPTPVGWG